MELPWKNTVLRQDKHINFNTGNSGHIAENHEQYHTETGTQRCHGRQICNSNRCQLLKSGAVSDHCEIEKIHYHT